MREFGWNRGQCIELDQTAFNVWGAWLSILEKGEYVEGDTAPYAPLSSTGDISVTKSLQNCYDVASRQGKQAHDFIDWIGYAIGIAWCSKSPVYSESIETYLEEHFPWEGFITKPYDYLSGFLAENGSSGHLDYYPTPLSITTAMALMMNPDWTDSVIEPCIGPGSIILPVKSLNMVGMDLNLLMVKAASIQAFFYKPQLLYTPEPILGIHVHKVEQRVHQYYEFKTDTRIYCGNSLLGEFYAPQKIFEQDSVMEDIYVNPLRQRNREVYKYREEMQMDWHSLSKSLRFELVKVMAREHSFDVVLTNPPFSSKVSAMEKQKMQEIEQDNILFMAELEAIEASYQNEENEDNEDVEVTESVYEMTQLALF